ncbi:MAG: protein translocase subunit SecD, partial [Frankiaceae bacterium]
MAAAPRNPVARPALLRLGVLALIVVAAYATMALTGNMSPKLGLDLQGGTTVTLTPVVLQGGSPPSGSVDKAVDIIRQRVNALGVSSAEVKRVGDKIEVAVPGKGRAEVLSLVGTTAELQFREVVTRADATPSPAPTPTPTPSPSGSPKPSASSTPSATSGATTTVPAASPAPSASRSPNALAPLAPDRAAGTTAKLAAFHRLLTAATPAAAPAAAPAATPAATP